MSDATKAVFLSYAREDTDAARRVAEALRGFGVEVWFDQSELRGGDQWDAKIRGQIKACALFIPIISQQTEARTEGYFRREWKIAIDRTQDMGRSRVFVVPVVIDDTAEKDAEVPEEFMRYQWARLTKGEPTPEFVSQIKQLLDSPKKPDHPRPPTLPAHLKDGKAVGASLDDARGTQDGRRQATPLQSIPGWIWAGLGVVLLGVAVGVALLRPSAPPPPAAASASEPKPALSSPTPLTSSLSPAAAVPTTAKSIAVLPFTNLSEDKDANAFFADGMHEDILTNLAFIKDLRVVSRTSVMQYRNTTKTISEIARDLKVAYVLEGSVRRAGNKVRVTGQLIRAATDEHVWASNYDKDLTDVFAIQAELAKAIAGALQAVLSPETKALLERRPTEVPAAYDAYLRARQIENSGNFFNARDTAALLRRAVELDPQFAAAWAALGANEAFVYFKSVQTPAQLALAKTAIDHAVRLAPDDPTVIEGLGSFHYYGHRDYNRATEQFLRLAQLRPNDAMVYARLGYVQRRQGRLPEAVANFRRAAELDPLSALYETDVLWTLLGVRRYAEAEARSRKFLQLHPGHLYGQAVLSQAGFARGDRAAGRALAAQSVPPSDRAEHLYIQLQNARIAADWAEAIRLDREQRYFDHDSDNPPFLQDVLAAVTLAEAGDPAAGRARATEAVALMKEVMIQQPLNAQLWAALGLAHGLLGARDDALRCAAKARELLPESRDAPTGAAISALCASALAYAGETDRALAEFERLLHVPFGTNPILDRGIFTGSWKPLRDNPRFQALLADPKNNAPLF